MNLGTSSDRGRSKDNVELQAKDAPTFSYNHLGRARNGVYYGGAQLHHCNQLHNWKPLHYCEPSLTKPCYAGDGTMRVGDGGVIPCQSFLGVAAS